MQLISGVGEAAVTLDPLAFDWENITQEELKDLRMVQVPGAHNPLGRIRVLMPNSYNIYLHDTNEPQYFERASRAASSGCVRMKDPERMANFILQGRKGWDARDLPEVLVDGETRDLFIPEPIPVYMLYYTVWINDQGDLVYGQDLYQFDENLIKMLKNIDGFFIPVDNT
jgi:murein L,D-transpeptidase YcbB/YkuD